MEVFEVKRPFSLEALPRPHQTNVIPMARNERGISLGMAASRFLAFSIVREYGRLLMTKEDMGDRYSSVVKHLT